MARMHGTDTNTKALTEKKMPVLMTLRDEECAHDKIYRSYN